MRPIGCQLADEVLTTAVAQQVIVPMETQGGPEHRVGVDEARETGFDEVVERIVERAQVNGLVRAWQAVWLLGGVARGHPTATSEPDETGRGLVSLRAARTATIVVSMSSTVTP